LARLAHQTGEPKAGQPAPSLMILFLILKIFKKLKN